MVSSVGLHSGVTTAYGRVRHGNLRRLVNSSPIRRTRTTVLRDRRQTTEKSKGVDRSRNRKRPTKKGVKRTYAEEKQDGKIRILKGYSIKTTTRYETERERRRLYKDEIKVIKGVREKGGTLTNNRRGDCKLGEPKRTDYKCSDTQSQKTKGKTLVACLSKGFP